MANKHQLNHQILVGTHHKTGSIWMFNIFLKIAIDYGFKMLGNPRNNIDIKKSDIIFENHSKFNFENYSNFRGLHLIRDPRDMIVSGCFYHQKTKKEKWLHTPRKKFGGMSYREKLNSLKNLDDQLLFEMENSAFINIIDIKKFHDSLRIDFLEIKYEDLMIDEDLFLFHKIFHHLGLTGTLLTDALKIAYNNSLFSNKVKDEDHIRSGKVSQWTNYFKPMHKKRFEELFGNVLVELGYEPSNNW